MVIDFAFRHHSLYLWGANYSTTGCQCSGKAWWLPHLTRLLNRRTKYKRSGESARSAGRNQETGTYGRFIPTRRLVSRLQSISKFNFTPTQFCLSVHNFLSSVALDFLNYFCLAFSLSPFFLFQEQNFAWKSCHSVSLPKHNVLKITV